MELSLSNLSLEERKLVDCFADALSLSFSQIIRCQFMESKGNVRVQMTLQFEK